MNTQRARLLVLAILALLVGGCVSQSPTESLPPMKPAPSVTDTPSKPIEFTLQTAVDGGKIFYVGVGGDIDGIVNPDLIVQPGDIVHAVILNGDGLPHDLTFPDFNAHTSIVASKDQEAEVTFAVNRSGTFAYYCTVTGHRQLGQEGKLIASEL